MREAKILILDDEKDLLESCLRILKQHHYVCLTTDDPSEALRIVSEEEPDLVLMDLRMPKKDGMEILKEFKDLYPSMTIIIITAYGTVQSAVDAMKLGAFDYITKPFSMDELIVVTERALQVRELTEENRRMRRDLSGCYGYPNMVGDSPEMEKVYDLVDRVSKTDSTTLILGENGTGKELVATTIHYQSRRRNGPFIRVNCSAFPENLVESELFGHDRGAFTGADRRKPGRFERADHGTIFLDEIGELPPSIQAKLLRVLQDGSFERLGGTEALSVDVRVIAATNRNLEEDVKSGRFREDLYYRLNIIPVHIPALRKRKEDIPLLIDHFLNIFNCRFGRRVAVAPEAIMALIEYSFPGNVRELGNILERCVALSTEDIIDAAALPAHIIGQQKSPAADTLSQVAADAEKAHIVKVLESTRGNRTKAAEILGISRKSLWEKVKTHDIE